MITIKALAFSKKIAKQVRIVRPDGPDFHADAKVLGWVARDAVEQGSPKYYLVEKGGQYAFVDSRYNVGSSYTASEQIFLT